MTDDWFDNDNDDKKINDENVDIMGEPVSDTEIEPDKGEEVKEDVKVEGTVHMIQSESAAINTLHNLRAKLLDKRFIINNNLNFDTCKKLHGIIGEMASHGGELVEGYKTIDGMTMYPCAKHDYAPIYNCLTECNKFDGHDNTGVCTAREAKIPGYKRYTHLEALQIEREKRSEGYQFANIASRKNIRESQKNFETFELECEKGASDEKEDEKEVV